MWLPFLMYNFALILPCEKCHACLVRITPIYLPYLPVATHHGDKRLAMYRQ